MTINELYFKLKNMEFPLSEVSVSLDMFKVVPTLWLYKGVVKTYIESSFLLRETRNMTPPNLKEGLSSRQRQSRL